MCVCVCSLVIFILPFADKQQPSFMLDPTEEDIELAEKAKQYGMKVGGVVHLYIDYSFFLFRNLAGNVRGVRKWKKKVGAVPQRIARRWRRAKRFPLVSADFLA